MEELNYKKQLMDRMMMFIQELKWEMTEEQTDGYLSYKICSPKDREAVDAIADDIMEFSRADAIKMTERILSIFTDTFTIDAISYNTDGDLEDVKILINAQVHLAE